MRNRRRVRLAREYVQALRGWWRGDYLLQSRRHPFVLSAVPKELIELLKREPDLIPHALRMIDDRNRRDRVRAVPDAD